MANVSWRKLGQVASDGDIYLMVIFHAIMTRQLIEVDTMGKVLLTCAPEVIDDMEAVFNHELPFDCPKSMKCFKSKYEGTKGAVLEARTAPGKDPKMVGFTKIKKTKDFGSNTGSGAGAKATEMFESAACWMTALAYHNNKEISSGFVIQESDFKPLKEHVKTTAKMHDVYLFLSNNSDWLDSSIKTANKLFSDKTYYNKDYHFYRGADVVNIIETHFKKVNKEEGRPFSNINKWTPADIYMCACGFDFNRITQHSLFAPLNAELESLVKSKELVGVSLKSIEHPEARLTPKNFTGAVKDSKKFSGMRAKSLFDSMDVYFTADGVEVQFRATDTAGKTWQGEVMGAAAKHGKIGGGVLDKVLKDVLGTGFFARTGYAKVSAVATAADTLDEKIYDLAIANKNIFEDKNEEITLDAIGKKNPKWKFAKYLGLVLADIMRTAGGNAANDIATKLYLYATSESDQSAPYIKVH